MHLPEWQRVPKGCQSCGDPTPARYMYGIPWLVEGERVTMGRTSRGTYPSAAPVRPSRAGTILWMRYVCCTCARSLTPAQLARAIWVPQAPDADLVPEISDEVPYEVILARQEAEREYERSVVGAARARNQRR